MKKAPAAEKSAAEKSAAEKSAAEKSAAEKSAAEQRAAEKAPASAKSAAEQKTGGRPYVLIGLVVAFVVIFLFGLMPAILLTSGKESIPAPACSLVVTSVEPPAGDAQVSQLAGGLELQLAAELEKVTGLTVRAAAGDTRGEEGGARCTVTSELTRSNGELVVTSRVSGGAGEADVSVVETRIPQGGFDESGVAGVQLELATRTAARIAALLERPTAAGRSGGG